MDISATGMLLLPSHRAPQGLQMSIDLGFPRLECVRVDAVLMREGEAQGSYAWGVRFTNIPTYVRSLLRDFVSQRIKGVPDSEMVFGVDRPRLAAPTPLIAPAVIPFGDHDEHVAKAPVRDVRRERKPVDNETGSGLYIKIFRTGEHVEKPIRPGRYRRVMHTPPPTLPTFPPTPPDPKRVAAPKHPPPLRPPPARSNPARPLRSRTVAVELNKVAHKAEDREREPTPIEVRELYDEALRDLDSERGKKKRRK